MADGLTYDPAALARDVAAARGACRLAAGAGLHETIALPGDLAGEAEKQAFLRAFRWQFFAEVSRETGDETIAPESGPLGRGRGRFGPRREFNDHEAGLVIAAAKLIPQAEIARALNRSHASVRNLLTRVRRGRWLRPADRPGCGDPGGLRRRVDQVIAERKGKKPDAG